MIQNKRKALWEYYYRSLQPYADKGIFTLPQLPSYATNNAHMFYLLCNNLGERTDLIKRLKDNNILAVFHYLSLHSSDFYKDKYDGRELPNCDHYADCIVRLPLYFELEEKDLDLIVNSIIS